MDKPGRSRLPLQFPPSSPFAEPVTLSNREGLMRNAQEIGQQYHFRHMVPQNKQELQRSIRALKGSLSELRKAAQPIIEVRDKDERIRRELSELRADSGATPKFRPPEAQMGSPVPELADLVSIRPSKI